MLLYLLLATRKNLYTTRKGNRISVIVCVYLLVAVQWISIATAIKPDLNAGLLFPCIVGVALITIGNLWFIIDCWRSL
ncbi:MAG: hypothetical protein PUC65_08905 [Clostridiales bacterium]|nr:hypothetical protein [Clostridiales bacterium]